MASDLMNVGATGKYYKVQPNGKAQAGLKEGDRVVTGGGTYQILEVKSDGSYRSALYDENITTKNYRGKYDNNPYSGSLDTRKKHNLSYDSDAKNRYDRINSKKPKAYDSKYKKDMERILNEIEGREDFSYDLSSDALYQQYKESYMNTGKQLMEDVSGQSAALSGGYGNSYGASASSAAYERYIQKLNDKIPELYQNARRVYDAEGDKLYNLYSLYANADKQAYSKYRDSVSDWQNERNTAYKEYAEELERQHQREKMENDNYWKQKDLEFDEREFDLKKEQFDYEKQKFDYKKEQDNIKAMSKAVSKGSSRSSSKSSGGMKSGSYGKKVTNSLFDDALEEYNQGGEKALKRYADKLYGSGYSSNGINSVLNYARKYGSKKAVRFNNKKSENGFNSILIDMFNGR